MKLFQSRNVLSMCLSVIIFSGFTSASVAASQESEAPTFKASIRTFNPNRCNYYSTIEAELLLETSATKNMGALEAYMDVHASYARNSPETWYSMGQALPFGAKKDEAEKWVYRIQKRFTISARGSVSYDRLRFQVNQSSSDLHRRLPMSGDPRYFYVIELKDLSPSCDPDDQTMTSLPVAIECMDLPSYPKCKPDQP